MSLLFFIIFSMEIIGEIWLDNESTIQHRNLIPRRSHENKKFLKFHIKKIKKIQQSDLIS